MGMSSSRFSPPPPSSLSHLKLMTNRKGFFDLLVFPYNSLKFFSVPKFLLELFKVLEGSLGFLVFF